MPTRGAPLHRLLVLALLVPLGSGCARVFRSHDLAPSGLTRPEHQLRELLAHGQAATALTRLSSDRALPHDEVLRALYQGVIAYHAGDYAASARVLDVAGELADDRITKSLSRSALSLITNDLVLPYEPGPTERLMIPYYAVLARLQLGDTDGATVEARRLSLLLQHFDDDARVDATLRSTLRYFAASVFATAGERNDADVAFRNALSLGCTLPAPDLDASADSGTVVVVLEQGFVAHRVEQGLMVWLLPEEIDRIAGEGDDRAATATHVATRVLNYAASSSTYSPGQRSGMLFVPPPDHTPRKRKRKKTTCTERVEPADSASGSAAKRVQECREVEEEVDDLPYLLKVAWPVFRTDFHPTQAVRVLGTHDTVSFAPGANLSRAIVSDFERERMLVVARTIARGTAKLALTKGAEHKLEEKNEAAAKVIGLLGNVGNVLLERADTRSWHLLPAGISLAYVRLPVGDHALAIELGDNDSASSTVVTAPVTVRAGQVSIAPVRVW